MDKKKIIFGGFAAAALSGLFYYLYKRLTKVQLSPWLEEYINELAEQVKKADQDKPLPLELIAFILNLLEEVEEHIYKNENPDLDTERQNALVDKKLYEELVYETILLREQCLDKARKIVEGRLNVSIHNLQEIMAQSDKAKLKTLLKENKKTYGTLPDVNSELLKKAYVEWVRTSIVHDRIAMKNFEAARYNPDYRTIAYEMLVFNKFLLKDKIAKDYKIEEKYFDQLLVKHNLLQDEEIRACKEELAKLSVS